MKLKLSHKVLLLVLFSALMSAGAMVGVASSAVSAELQRQLKVATERCVRLLDTSFAAKVAGVSATPTTESLGVRLTVPRFAAFRDDSIVDDNVKLLGGTASIFTFDDTTDNFIRCTTSIKDSQGRRLSGTPLALDSPAQPFLRRGEAYSGPTVIYGQPYYAVYQPVFDVAGRVDGVLYAGYPMQRIYYQGYRNIMLQMGGTSLLLEVALLIVVSVIAHRLFAPLLTITRRIEGLRQGDLTSPMPDVRRADEIGDMAMSVAMFQRVLQANKEAETLSRNRSLEDVRRAGSIVSATQSFETQASTLVQSLSASVHAMDRAADAVALSSCETQNEASIVLEAAKNATDVLGSVTVAALDLSRSAATISTEMIQSSAVAASALEDAMQTKTQVAHLVTAAHEIDDAVRFIEDIARQTNLLAFNATIEAANAGEAGRGFAIVAGEVKFLARRTAEATTLINERIQLIQRASERTAEGINLVAATLDHMNAISSTTAAAMSEQSRSSGDIAAALTRAAVNAEIVLTCIHQVNSTAIANGDRASDLRTTAAGHGEQAGHLGTFITMFASEMRGATGKAQSRAGNL